MLQGLLDWVAYGSFGSSLAGYALANFGGTASSVLYRLGFAELGTWLYDHTGGGAPIAAEREAGLIYQRFPPLWYLREAPFRCLAPPVLLCVLLGAARGLRRPSWAWLLLVLTLAANVAVMSTKGSKSFRLWLPLLPLFALLGSSGWQLLRGAADRAGRPRRAVAALVLGASALLGVGLLFAADTRRHGGYWRALDHVAR